MVGGQMTVSGVALADGAVTVALFGTADADVELVVDEVTAVGANGSKLSAESAAGVPGGTARTGPTETASAVRSRVTPKLSSFRHIATFPHPPLVLHPWGQSQTGQLS